MKNIKTIMILFLLSMSFVIVTGFSDNAFAASKKESAVKKYNTQKPNFAKGAKLWVSRCSSCHNIRDPKDLTDKDWKIVVNNMRIRAGLSGQDARDVLEFLQRSN